MPTVIDRSKAALEIDGLTKRYGDFTAVSDLFLRVYPGEIYAFLGPNGAGKTTTLRATAGLLGIDGGRVAVAGHPVEPDAIEFRNLLGYIPDRPYLYEKLTAWEHLQFVAGARRLKAWEETARGYMRLLSLEEWSGQMVEGFSHGMRQKLNLAAALLHAPSLLMVDEPMVGLDPRSCRIVKELFKRLAAEGAGIFLCTHSLDVAQDLADRIGILNRGKLIAEGTFDELGKMAKQPGSSLEEIFLALTEEEERH